MQFKPIPGWTDYYEVSDTGVVRSIGRTIHVKNPKGIVAPRTYRERLLKKTVAKNGYEMVSFTAPEREREYHYVHALVMAAFVGPAPAGMECCHNNGVRSDNRLENLRYDTRSANAADRVRHGTIPDYRGSKANSAKLTDQAVTRIRALAGKQSARSLGREYGVCHKTITAVIKRESWSHI